MRGWRSIKRPVLWGFRFLSLDDVCIYLFATIWWNGSSTIKYVATSVDPNMFISICVRRYIRNYIQIYEFWVKNTNWTSVQGAGTNVANIGGRWHFVTLWDDLIIFTGFRRVRNHAWCYFLPLLVQGPGFVAAHKNGQCARKRLCFLCASAMRCMLTLRHSVWDVQKYLR